MTKLIGLPSDSWCSIFPHPKEAILNDINNYVCSVASLVFSFLLMRSFKNRTRIQWERTSLRYISTIWSMSRNRSSWEDISGYHGSRRRRNHLARSFKSYSSRSIKRIPQTQGNIPFPIYLKLNCINNTNRNIETLKPKSYEAQVLAPGNAKCKFLA